MLVTSDMAVLTTEYNSRFLFPGSANVVNADREAVGQTIGQTIGFGVKQKRRVSFLQAVLRFLGFGLSDVN